MSRQNNSNFLYGRNNPKLGESMNGRYPNNYGNNIEGYRGYGMSNSQQDYTSNPYPSGQNQLGNMNRQQVSQQGFRERQYDPQDVRNLYPQNSISNSQTSPMNKQQPVLDNKKNEWERFFSTQETSKVGQQPMNKNNMNYRGHYDQDMYDPMVDYGSPDYPSNQYTKPNAYPSNSSPTLSAMNTSTRMKSAMAQRDPILSSRYNPSAGLPRGGQFSQQAIRSNQFNALDKRVENAPTNPRMQGLAPASSINSRYMPSQNMNAPLVDNMERNSYSSNRYSNQAQQAGVDVYQNRMSANDQYSPSHPRDRPSMINPGQERRRNIYGPGDPYAYDIMNNTPAQPINTYSISPSYENKGSLAPMQLNRSSAPYSPTSERRSNEKKPIVDPNSRFSRFIDNPIDFVNFFVQQAVYESVQNTAKPDEFVPSFPTPSRASNNAREADRGRDRSSSLHGSLRRASRVRPRSPSPQPASHSRGDKHRRVVESSASSHKRSRSPAVRRSRSRTPIRQKDNKTKRSATKFSLYDFFKQPFHKLVADFNVPAIQKNNFFLTPIDLYSKFPNLYIPEDFIGLNIDWPEIMTSLNAGIFHDLVQTVPYEFESSPKELCLSTHHLITTEDFAETEIGGNGENEEEGSNRKAGVGSDDSKPAIEQYIPAIQQLKKKGNEVPKFSYLNANFTNNLVTDEHLGGRLGFNALNHFQETEKLVKFNVRIMVSFGMNNSDKDRIDHHFTKKLRFLCGRKKGSIMLLGTSWCKEIDGGNPLADRSCLYRSVRRALFAQSLLDIETYTGNSDLVHLGDILYHRPEEEIRGKVFPEQEEITALFLYSLPIDHPLLTDTESFERSWKLFSIRSQGLDIGPSVNESPDVFWEDFSSYCNKFQSDRSFQHHGDPHPTNVKDGSSSNTINSTEKVSSENDLNPEVNSSNTPEKNDTDGDAESGDKESGEIEENTITFSIDKKASEVNLEDADLSQNPDQSDTKGKSKDPKNSKAKSRSSSHPQTIKKPSHPTVLLCPMPLPKEAMDDASKKQDALSLRILPLSSITSYTQDDCSERVFEASITGEIIKSLISINFANLISDFVTAENPGMNEVADFRIKSAVGTLRDLVQKAKSKAKKSSNQVEQSKPQTSPQKDNQKPSNDPCASEKPLEVPETSESNTLDDLSKDQTKKVDEDVEIIESTEIIQEKKEETETPSELVSTEQGETNTHPLVSVEAEVNVEEANDPQDVSQQDLMAIPMDETQARLWRRRFVAACRWFDIKQEHFLRTDLLQFILYSSTRNLSRAGAMLASERVSKDDKLRFESFI